MGKFTKKGTEKERGTLIPKGIQIISVRVFLSGLVKQSQIESSQRKVVRNKYEYQYQRQCPWTLECFGLVT